jgi:hypothetical protein
MKNLITFEEFVNESLNEAKDEIVFSIDDDKLDQMLNSKFSRQLDYKDDKGDSFYVLTRKDFDRFIDLADSSGFDVDYENSEDSVIDVQESLKENMNESSRVRFNHNKYYIVFDWYIQGQISPTAIGKEFSTEDEAEKNIDGWKNELSMRMSHNVTRLEARNTLDSFIVLDGGQLNDANKYEFYVSLD